MGDANASIPTPQPVLPRPMFGADGGDGRRPRRCTSSRRAALEGGLADRLAVRRRLVPVRDTRRLAKADMPHNDALPRIEVEPDTFTVRVDGEVVEPAPAEVCRWPSGTSCSDALWPRCCSPTPGCRRAATRTPAGSRRWWTAACCAPTRTSRASWRGGSRRAAAVPAAAAAAACALAGLPGGCRRATAAADSQQVAMLRLRIAPQRPRWRIPATGPQRRLSEARCRSWAAWDAAVSARLPAAAMRAASRAQGAALLRTAALACPTPAVAALRGAPARAPPARARRRRGRGRGDAPAPGGGARAAPPRRRGLHGGGAAAGAGPAARSPPSPRRPWRRPPSPWPPTRPRCGIAAVAAGDPAAAARPTAAPCPTSWPNCTAHRRRPSLHRDDLLSGINGRTPMSRCPPRRAAPSGSASAARSAAARPRWSRRCAGPCATGCRWRW